MTLNLGRLEKISASLKIKSSTLVQGYRKQRIFSQNTRFISIKNKSFVKTLMYFKEIASNDYTLVN